MFAFFEFSGHSKRRMDIETFANQDDAEKFARETYKIIHMERDDENPECTDIFTGSGRILVIEKVK